jgi:hypothetical protein
MSEDHKIEIPDVFGDALIQVMNAAHAKGELVTGFVCLLETYNGKRKSTLTHRTMMKILIQMTMTRTGTNANDDQ